jgi:hypothetical protein
VAKVGKGSSGKLFPGNNNMVSNLAFREQSLHSCETAFENDRREIS